MKKLFTLFMATVVAGAMMALPQVKVAGKKAAPASFEQFEAKNPAQVKVMDMHKVEMVKRSFERPASVAKVAPAVATPKKVAKVEGEVVKLHFDGFSVEPEYYEETGDWYMACTNDEYIVKFDIVTNGASYLGHWTTEDFDLYYSYMYTPTDYVDYVSIDCTISEEKKGQYLTQINLAATIEGTDGITYEVTCEHMILEPAATEDHVITAATLDFDGEKFTLAGSNDTLDVNLAVWATWPAGRFTKGEFDMEETVVKLNGVEQVLLNPEVVMGVDVVDEVPSYVGDFQFYNQDTVLHNVHMVAPLPAPTDTVEITLHNLNVDDSWAMFFGWVYLTAADAKWDVYAGVAAMQAEEGTWKGEDVMLYITDLETFDAPEAIYAKITVTEGEDGWAVFAEGQCDDGKYYVVDMKFEIPEPTRTVELRFENSAKASFYPDLGNDLMLSNENDDYYVALDIYNVPMGSEFTLDNMDTYYTQLIDWNNMVELQIADVKGKIDQNGDTTIMTAEVICFDSVLYDVELWYVVPTPTDTIQLTVEAAFDNQLEAQGYYTLNGQDETGNYLVAMSPISSEVEGTFVNDGMFAHFGAEDGRYDFLSTYTYVAKPIGEDEWGDTQYDVYSVEKGTLTVTMDEDDNIVAKASVICSNAVLYEITLTSKYDIPHLEYDAEEPVEQLYNASDELAIEYDEQYGVIYFDVVDADHTNTVSLVFFVEETDADVILPAGTYPIDASQDYGTVLASDGYDGYYVYPSLYGNINEDGNFLAPLWFLVGGEVEVKKLDDNQLYVEVNAVNSYNQEIHIVYDPTADALENIQSEDINSVKKMMIDGQLVIIRNGKAYNAVGAQVK